MHYTIIFHNFYAVKAFFDGKRGCVLENSLYDPEEQVVVRQYWITLPEVRPERLH